MTSNAAFNHFVNTLFGAGTIGLDEAITNDNNIIGAIRHSYEDGQFGEFAKNLKARFQRLQEATKDDVARRQILIQKINNLASDRWQGYYCEIAAYDYFCSFGDVEFEVQVPASETLASRTGDARHTSSFDGRLRGFSDLTFEVKAFRDTSRELLDKVCSVAILGTAAQHITASYPNDIDYRRIQDNFRRLIQMLKEAIGRKEVRFTLSPELPELSFSIFYTPQQVLTTEHSYSPYRHAQESETFVLNHFDQLFDKQNNLLVYVSHPWTNSLHSPFMGREQFLYAFCRRVFCKLFRESRPIAEIMPNRWPKATITVSDVIKRIGGILFLFDDNVEPVFHQSPRPVVYPLTAYLYLNPNAARENKGIAFRELVSELPSGTLVVLEDYAFDNY